jgi:Holliday junction resolvase RusA-like endonuclease
MTDLITISLLEIQETASAVGQPDIALTVYGTPGPQGSKSFKGMRASKDGTKQVPVLIESSKKVKPWRALVADAAKAAGFTPLAGPLAVSMHFTLKPPQSMPKDRIVDGVAYPTCYPDTSKLIRSTEDALTKRAWFDDAQIVEHRDCGKHYPGQHPDALEAPGAVIRIWRIGGAL